MNEHGHFRKLTSFVSCIISLFPKVVARMLYSLTRNTGGGIFMGVRYVCIKRLAASCGENVAVFPHVTLKRIEKLHIGNNVSIHTMCYLDALGEIVIGNNVSIAHQSSLVSFDHMYSDSSIPIKYNHVKKGKITIEDDVWVGCGCRILQGVTIHSRSIIAAGAVVTKDVEPNSLYGGVPAKLLKRINS